MARLTTENLQGIPQPYTPFKVTDPQFGRWLAVSAATTANPIVEEEYIDHHSNLLVHHIVREDRGFYNILSLKNGLALTGQNPSWGEREVFMQLLEEFSEKKIWTLVPSKIFSDRYYGIQNYSTEMNLQNTAVADVTRLKQETEQIIQTSRNKRLNHVSMQSHFAP
ncbi:hypothetical protein AXG93_620s1010 [Marchantia polymorpha subsp. ruderalis]|uniref:Uncharacterized protein n=1 Tax=Marchantia polymorpha subsp. ruderalis TaxID=1480154 RepID=A0A176VQP8_MARPO|nr:hypothetical protein AXG93_620s1010 [Marchantia polymorpha subsp. ruderalis]